MNVVGGWCSEQCNSETVHCTLDVLCTVHCALQYSAQCHSTHWLAVSVLDTTATRNIGLGRPGSVGGMEGRGWKDDEVEEEEGECGRGRDRGRGTERGMVRGREIQEESGDRCRGRR